MSLTIFLPPKKGNIPYTNKIEILKYCKIICAALRCINPYVVLVLRLHPIKNIFKILNGNNLRRKNIFQSL